MAAGDKGGGGVWKRGMRVEGRGRSNGSRGRRATAIEMTCANQSKSQMAQNNKRCDRKGWAAMNADAPGELDRRNGRKHAICITSLEGREALSRRRWRMANPKQRPRRTGWPDAFGILVTHRTPERLK